MSTSVDSVHSFSVTDRVGRQWQMSASNEVMDFFDAGSAFGADDLSDDPLSPLRQRRIVGLPDARGPAITPMVLTLGRQNRLSLLRRDNGSLTGWEWIDLTPGLEAVTGPGYSVRCCAATHLAGDRIAIAVSMEGPAGSRLLVSYDLSSRNSNWSQLPWIDAGARSGVQIDGLRLVGTQAKGWTVCIIGRSSREERSDYLVYLLHSGVSDQRFANAVTFPTAFTLNDLSSSAVGVRRTGPGLYTLGTTGGDSTLSFRAFPEIAADGSANDIPPTAALPPVRGARVIECGITGRTTLPGRRGATVWATDLYVGGEGVSLLSAEAQDDVSPQWQTVIGPEDASGVADVVVADRPDDERASVWARLDDGGLVVCRREAGWSKPLRLRSAVVEIAPVMGDDHLVTSLLVVYADGRGGHIWQDRATGAWLEAEIVVPNPEGGRKVTCYNTYLRLVDENGMAREGVPVTIRSTAASYLRVNDSTVFVGPNTPAVMETDWNGGVHILNRARSLTPALLRLSIPDIDDQVEINPAGPLHKRFRDMKVGDLRNAKAHTDGGETYLVPEEFRSGPRAAELDGVVQCLQHAGRLTSRAQELAPGVTITSRDTPFRSSLRMDGGENFGLHLADGQIAVSSGAAVADPGADRGVLAGFGDTISDFFEGLLNRATKAVSDTVDFVVRKAGEAWEFVCSVGRAIKRFVVRAWEEVSGFLTGVWETIKVTAQKVWDFVKFVFDWDDISRARDAISDMLRGVLKAGAATVPRLKEPVTNAFAVVEGMLKNSRPEANRLGKRTVAAAVAESSKGSFLDKLLGNPVITWIKDQIGKVLSWFSELINLELPDVTPEEEALAVKSMDFLSGGAQVLVDLIDPVWTKAKQEYDDAMAGRSLTSLDWDDAKELLVRLGYSVVEGAFAGVKAFALGAIDAIAGLFVLAEKVLFMRIRFPFLEKLIRLFSPSSNPDISFSIAEILSLFLAIPLTLVTKLSIKVAPFLPGEDLTHYFQVVGDTASGVVKWGRSQKKRILMCMDLLMRLYNVIDAIVSIVSAAKKGKKSDDSSESWYSGIKKAVTEKYEGIKKYFQKLGLWRLILAAGSLFSAGYAFYKAIRLPNGSWLQVSEIATGGACTSLAILTLANVENGYLKAAAHALLLAVKIIAQTLSTAEERLAAEVEDFDIGQWLDLVGKEFGAIAIAMGTELQAKPQLVAYIAGGVGYTTALGGVITHMVLAWNGPEAAA